MREVQIGFYWPPDCGKSNHVPIKVKRGKKPDFIYCEVCKRRLKLAKREAIVAPDTADRH